MPIPTPTPATLEYALRAFVAEGTGLNVNENVIPGNDNGPAPNDLYATVLLVNDEELGVKNQRIDDDPNDAGLLKMTSRSTNRALYSVQFYRAGATDSAHAMRAWCGSPQGIDRAEERGFVIQKYGMIVKLDTIMAEGFEERAGVDLTVDYVQTLEQSVGKITTVGFATNTDAEREVSSAA